MRIILSSIYHISRYYGGNEHYFHYLAEGLVKAGHEVIYLTSEAETDFSAPYTLKVIPVSYIWGKPVYSLAWNDYIHRMSADIFHAAGSGIALALTGLQLKNRMKRVITFQAPNNPTSKLKQVGGYLEMEMMPRAFDAIITTGPHNKELLRTRWPGAHVVMIPMMLAEHFLGRLPSRIRTRKKYGITERDKVVVFIGKLDTHHYYKGFEVAIEAMAMLGKNYRLLAAGDGDLFTTYQRNIMEHGLENRIRLLGNVANMEIPKLLRAGDVFVLPSTSSSEGFGLVLLEAMACMVPCITTTVVGSARWLDEAGVVRLVAPNDAKALAGAIRKVGGRQNKRAIENARSFATQFTSEKMVSETVRLYERLLK